MKQLKRWKRYIVLYWKMQLQNIRSLTQYRADFLIMLFFTSLSQVCNLAVIGIIYNNIPLVDGWSLWEILLLYGYLLFSEGAVNFFFQGAWKITQMLNKGEIDRFLVRPIPVGLQLITAKIDFDGLNKMFIASVLFGLSMSHCVIHWSVGKVLYFIGTLFVACIIRFAMIWIASCASFWLQGAKNNLNFLVLSIGEMAKYPLTIYPSFLRGCFAYAIPYAFVAYYPVCSLLEKNTKWWNDLGILGVGILSVILSGVVLHAGMQRYESTGN